MNFKKSSMLEKLILIFWRKNVVHVKNYFGIQTFFGVKQFGVKNILA